jgi:hypothetical protein
MTNDKQAKELAKLYKKADKLGVVGYTDETTAEELEKLIAAAEDEAKKEKKTSFDVHNSDGGYVRTYSVEEHGEDAEKLANQYAGKIGGKVL